MKRVASTVSKSSARLLGHSMFASALPMLAAALAAFGCAGAGETGDDDTPMFNPSGLGGTGSSSPIGGGGQSVGVGASGTAGGGTGAGIAGSSGNLGGGNNSGTAGTSNTPAGTGGAPVAGGGSGGSAGSSAANGGSGGGNLPGDGPGRVGAELCPPGPFGDPLAAAPSVERLFTLEENNFFNFEGPVWIDDALYFSEIGPGSNPPPSRINRYELGATTFERGFIEDAGSNGLAVDASGNLLAATHDVGAITTFDLPDGVRGQLGAQTFNGQRFNSPNDLVLRGDGNLYFTDPAFQAPGNPQGGTRVYRIAPDGTASIVDGSLGNPNGITLSPDGNTLYVTSSAGLRRYALAADGTPDAGTTIQLDQGLTEPDGMAMDCAGNIYTTEHSARRIRVFDPEGNQLASFGGAGTFSNNVTNLAFGGPDRRTLFITTLTQNGGGVYAVQANIPGLPY